VRGISVMVVNVQILYEKGFLEEVIFMEVSEPSMIISY
jgi:hypothetical protein